MEIGKIITCKILRKTDLGYMVSDSNPEDAILLHFREAKGEHNPNDEVNVFVYYDKKGRLCATENEPLVSKGNPNFVTVCDVISNTGVFVSINTGKDVLVSKDYLPYDKSLWPDVNDKLLIDIKVKRDTIIGKPLNRFDIEDLKSETKYEINTMVPAYVYRIGEAGINLVTEDKVNVFVHKSMIRQNYHIGEMVVVKIIHEAQMGYNGSLIANKEEQIDPDKDLILNYLNANGGKMRLDSKSSSEEIDLLLHISRKAFKRALGGLYKDRLVEFKDGYTYKL